MKANNFLVQPRGSSVTRHWLARACLVFILAIAAWGSLRAADSLAAFSPNKRFVGALVERGNELELTIHRSQGESMERWWRSLCPYDSTWTVTPRLFVSEDGRSAVAQMRPSGGGNATALAFFSESHAPRAWSLDEVSALLPTIVPASSHSVAKLLGIRTAADEMEEAAGERERLWNWEGSIGRTESLGGRSLLFCLWAGGHDRWLGWNPQTGARATLSAEMNSRLNQSAREWATNLIAREVQLSAAAREATNSAARRIGMADRKFYPQAVEQLEQEIFSAYKFLAARKQPPDRAFLESLLRAEMDTSSHGLDRAGEGKEKWLSFSAFSSRRDLGDYLLACWDNRLDTSRKWDHSEGHPPERVNYSFLGKIKGSIQFGTPLTNGSVWLYLLPAEWAPGAWRTNSVIMHAAMDIAFGIESIRGPTPSPLFGNTRDTGFSGQARNVLFSLDGITPGTYRLKAVWDQHAGLASMKNPPDKPNTWQRESAEIGPLTITAASTREALIIPCTNEVTGSLERLVSTPGDRIVELRLPGHGVADTLQSAAQAMAVRAAAFRHIAARTQLRLNTSPAFYFLVCGEDDQVADPPPELLEQLKGTGPVAKPLSTAIMVAEEFTARGQRTPVPVIQLGSVEWRGEQAIVPGKCFRTRDESHVMNDRYLLARSDGQWKVIGIETR